MIGMGFLGTDQYNPKTDVIPVQCLESQVSRQDMIIYETRNNAIIGARLNSVLTIRLPYRNRTGGEWLIISIPFLQISNEGSAG